MPGGRTQAVEAGRQVADRFLRHLLGDGAVDTQQRNKAGQIDDDEVELPVEGSARRRALRKA